MMIRHFKFALVGVGVMFPVAVITSGGCGGSSDEATDAGSEAAADVVKDVAPDKGVIDSGASCIDADLTTLNPDDAALNDAGASIGTCVSCSRASCGSLLAQCNADCDCKEAVIAFYDCVAKGGGLQVCGIKNLGNLGGNAAAIGQNLGFCVLGACREQCGVPEGGIPGLDAGDGGG
jgi:hypothetical protein